MKDMQLEMAEIFGGGKTHLGKTMRQSIDKKESVFSKQSSMAKRNLSNNQANSNLAVMMMEESSQEQLFSGRSGMSQM